MAVVMALIWLALAATARAELERITRFWRTEQGLPQNTVTCVLRTSDGYVWVGTRQGLARFDGARFLSFTAANTPALRSDHITALAEDGKGGLWIGTRGGGVARLEQGKFVSFSVRHGLSSDMVNCLAVDHEGAVWIGTVYGLNRWRDGHFTSFFAKDGLPGVEVKTLACDPRGTLWAGTNSQLVYWAGGRFQALRSFPYFSVEHLAFDVAGDGWSAGKAHGLLLAQDGKMPLRQMLPLGEPLTALAASSQGGVWAALNDGRLLRGRGDGVESVGKKFASGGVLSLHDDGSGALLVGTRGEGLAALSPRFFEAYTDHQGPSPVVTTAVAEDGAGRVWSGGEAGQLAVWHDGRLHALDLGKAYTARTSVLALCGRADGSLWIGTRGDGLFRWHRGHVTAPRMEGRTPAAVVTALCEARDGSLWIGTEAEGILRYQDGAFTRHTTREGFARDQATTIAQQPDGALWFGTNGAGLSRLHQGNVRVFTTADGLGSATILAQHVDEEGRLWAGTAAGLSLWRDGGFFTFTRAHGLEEEMISQVTSDGAGHVWLGSLRGLVRCARADLLEIAAGRQKRLVATPFGLLDGLLGTECLSGRQNATLKDRAGHLWFATAHGLARTVAPPISTPTSPPPVFLERVEVNDREILADPLLRGSGATPPSAAIEVPAGHATVAFHFTSPGFRVPEKTRFRHQLVGFDQEWLPAQSARQALYTHVPAGRYTFRVAACDDGGVWSADDAATVAVIVQPFYWETWWFRAALALVAGLVIAAVAALRRARRREVERLRWRIAGDLHDELGSTLSGIALLSRRIDRQSTLGEREHAELREIADIARQTIHSVRDIVWFINPACDTAEEAAQRMRETAARLLADLPHELRITAAAGSQKVPPDFRRNMLMVFKEVLHNLVRHAHAGRAEVEARLETDRWSIAVRDDGRGFDPADKNSGSGLKNARLRLEQMQGVFRIESAPGRGTLVAFEARPGGK